MAEQFPIRVTRVALTRVRVALALLIATSIGATVTPSYAQTVPVPKPAPKARDPMSDSQRGPMTTGAMQAPNPVIPDPRRNVPASLFASFDANQKAQAARVSTYLSSLQTDRKSTRLNSSHI